MNNRSARQVVFDQFSLVEHFVQRLQLGVLRAYSSRTNFHNFIQEAIGRFEKDMGYLVNAPNHTELPAYYVLVASDSSLAAAAARHQMAQRFMTNWESIVSETDTKLTRL